MVTRLDVREEPSEYRMEERPTKIKSVDFGIYRKAVQSALEPLFETEPVLLKIQRGESVTPEELNRLNSLLHTRNPNVDLQCWRRLNSDPPCRSNIDPGRIAEFGISNCG